MIRVRRIYDPEEPGEHFKVFVDRLWPRGISKDKAGWDEWMKEISPTNELRKWYNHDPEKWERFKLLYRIELKSKKEELNKLKQIEIKNGTLTLLYSSKEKDNNNAQALKEILLNHNNDEI